MNVAEPQPAVLNPERRWFRFTPDQMVLALFAVEGLMLLSEWFGLFPKGWAVLIAVAAVGGAMILMVFWFIIAVIFHRWFQFSICSLLVLVVVVAIPYSWLAVEMQRASEQRKAVEGIERLGECVAYGYKFDRHGGQWPLLSEELPGSLWLRRLLGDDFFADVVGVSAHESEVNDAILEHLRVLPRLREVCLQSCQVSEKGVEFVGDLANLRELLLDGSNVSDEGLEHIAGLIQLDTLQLADTHVTDSGLEHLTRLAQLQFLDLSGTQVTNEGVKKLQQALPNCEIMRL